MASFESEEEEGEYAGPRYFCSRVDIDEDRFNEVSLNYDELNTNDLTEKAKSPKAGAVSSFLGITRDNFEGRVVTHLDYEAYPEMALTCMNNICVKIREQWGVMNILIEHKLGPCPILHTSVAIIISSEHREDSLKAVDFAINELKKTVPVWKKECYSTGDTTWKANNEALV